MQHFNNVVIYDDSDGSHSDLTMFDMRKIVLPVFSVILLSVLLNNATYWLGGVVETYVGSMLPKPSMQYGVSVLLEASCNCLSMWIALTTCIWIFRSSVDVSAVCKIVAIIFGSFAASLALMFSALQIADFRLIKLIGNFAGVATACVIVKAYCGKVGRSISRRYWTTR